MSDLSITATDVLPTGATRPNFPNKLIRFGETVAAGMPAYQKSSDLKYYKAIANDTAEKAGSVDIVFVVAGGAVNQWGLGQTGGQVTINTGTVGDEIVVSPATAGKCAPVGDLGSGNQFTSLGQITATGILTLDIEVKVAKA